MGHAISRPRLCRAYAGRRRSLWAGYNIVLPPVSQSYGERPIFVARHVFIPARPAMLARPTASRTTTDPREALALLAAALGRAESGNRKPGKAERVARVLRMLDAGAWIDASVALLELQQPQWKLRRLAYDGGQWLCSLSRRPDLPSELDETVDGHHECLPLAILQACSAACAAAPSQPRTVPRVRPIDAERLCCDNFA
jgi:hypothetical protein